MKFSDIFVSFRAGDVCGISGDSSARDMIMRRGRSWLVRFTSTLVPQLCSVSLLIVMFRKVILSRHVCDKSTILQYDSLHIRVQHRSMFLYWSINISIPKHASHFANSDFAGWCSTISLTLCHLNIQRCLLCILYWIIEGEIFCLSMLVHTHILSLSNAKGCTPGDFGWLPERIRNSDWNRQ